MTHKCNQGLILAAGRGTRLGKYGDSQPKSLYKFNGKSLLIRNIDMMIKNGIQEVIVIAGYKIDMIREELKDYKNIRIIENKHYEDTSTAYSMGLAYDYIENCFIQTEGDLVFEEKAMKELLKNSGNAGIHSEYRKTNSVSVPQFENGKLIYFTRELKYRSGIQQPPNYTGPSHFTKEMLKFIKQEDLKKGNELYYEEAVALSIFNNNIPFSFISVPLLRYWDLNKIEDYEKVKELINTLDEEAF